MQQQLQFDIGAAYDFFISIFVLTNPQIFGLRPSWAKGVRARLPARQREVIENAQSFLPVPLAWLTSLPHAQKDGSQALAALRSVPAEERLSLLGLRADTPDLVRETLLNLSQRGSPKQADLDLLREDLQRRQVQASNQALQNMVAAWGHPAEFGETYLDALESYQQVFFNQEEERIKPALEEGLRFAQKLAAELPRVELLERLSRGVVLEDLYSIPTITLAPSFWVSPLILITRLEANNALIVFGCRPEDQPLIPGDQVPRDMLAALDALSDSTRLRILRYLAGEPLTPGQLADRLRLRPPTVVHHLNKLRLAGLVRIELQADGERRYVLRRAGLETAIHNLDTFLSKPDVSDH